MMGDRAGTGDVGDDDTRVGLGGGGEDNTIFAD